jgi:putative ABC transport system ATP-binding protein
MAPALMSTVPMSTVLMSTVLVSTGAEAPTITDAASVDDPRPHNAVISIRGVSKRYGTGDTVVVALDDVSLDIIRGDFVAIMGTSGSGKSTLMNIVGCLDVPTDGTYFLDGHDVSELDDDEQAEIRNAMIGFVFQSFNLIRRTTACRQVELPMSYGGVGRRERRQRAIVALQAVGLGERIDHLPSQLSGGQQQRVAIARAIGTDPALILADEPTGALDSRSTTEVLDIFAKLHREGRSVVVITHEDEVAARAARVIRLVDGRIVSDVRNSPLGAPAPQPHLQPHPLPEPQSPSLPHGEGAVA